MPLTNCTRRSGGAGYSAGQPENIRGLLYYFDSADRTAGENPYEWLPRYGAVSATDRLLGDLVEGETWDGVPTIVTGSGDYLNFAPLAVYLAAGSGCTIVWVGRPTDNTVDRALAVAWDADGTAGVRFKRRANGLDGENIAMTSTSSTGFSDDFYRLDPAAAHVRTVAAICPIGGQNIALWDSTNPTQGDWSVGTGYTTLVGWGNLDSGSICGGPGGADSEAHHRAWLIYDRQLSVKELQALGRRFSAYT